MQASFAGSQQPLSRFLLQYYIAQSTLHNFQVISAEVEQRFAAGSFRSERDLGRSRSDESETEAGVGGRRTSREKERTNERDAYVSFLVVTGSTRRYRPREARTVPLLPYYILHNSNSERSELLPLPISRVGVY